MWSKWLCCVIGLAVLVAGSCVSTNAGAGQHVLDSARQLGELSEQNRQLADIVERQQELYNQFRDAISATEADAANAATDIRGAIKLLTEYKQRVDEYFKAVDSSQGKAKDGA